MTPLAGALRDQARSCAALGSPFTARLLRLLADRLTPDGPLGPRLFGWQGDISGAGQSVALRLAGGLHALVLSGQDAGLAAAYRAGADDAPLWQAVSTAMATHEPFLQDWLNSPPQTNEVRRSAVLIAVAHWLAARTGLPFVLSELGASAGVNLLWDRYALTLPGRTLGPRDPVLSLAPEWRGHPLPAAALDATPTVAARRGVDLNPLDPRADRLRLMAYVWADQADRLTRTAAALDEAARLRPAIDRGDAAAWLEARLANAQPNRLHLVFHTIAWQYFPQATRARASAALAWAGARAAPDAPLAHLGMEGDATPGSAALTLTLWPGGETQTLGRADFHGRWVDWQAP